MRVASTLPRHHQTDIDNGFWAYLAPLTLWRRLAGGFDDSLGTSQVQRPTSAMGPIPVTDQAAGDREPMETVRPWDPEIELFPRDGRLIIRADIPGFVAADLIVELEPDLLVIAGERRRAARAGGDGEPAFYQVIPIRHAADATRCVASVSNGVLEVAMPLPAMAPRSGAEIH